MKKLKTYLVKWEIELDAVSALDAAKMARAIQRDPESVALVFEVERLEPAGRNRVIDLWRATRKNK